MCPKVQVLWCACKTWHLNYLQKFVMFMTWWMWSRGHAVISPSIITSCYKISWNLETLKIQGGDLPIALKFNRRLSSIAIKPHAKLQYDTNALTPNLADPRLHKTCKKCPITIETAPGEWSSLWVLSRKDGVNMAWFTTWSEPYASSLDSEDLIFFFL